MPLTMITLITGEPSTELLERQGELDALAALLDDVREHRRGWLVLIAGEAGVGKTALLRRFSDERRASARILWGACDALYTPSPLGPLIEVAESSGGEVEALVHGGAKPYEVATALMHELGRHASSVLVLEDVHWADEATLDVIRLLGRKVEGVPALVLVSYRDELDRVHPLRVLTGELSTSPAVRRLRVDPLSPEAVARLAAPHGVDADDLYRKTGGNPFFVTEVLAAADAEIPNTVRDAVLARAARLSPEARDLLEAVAAVPPRGETWLLEALAPEAIDRVEECLASGMLSSGPEGVVFRHELARLAIEESLPSDRRVILHRKALGALAAPPTGSPDLARLAHHAEAAGDAEAVVRFAPQAAARAASLGAHREAAAQYARALRFGERLQPEERAEFLSRRAAECYLADENDEAIEAQRAALECYRELDDRLREGDSLRSLSQILWCPGKIAESRRAGRDAVAVLEELPPGRELAMAYSNLASLLEDAALSQRALDLAERVEDTRIALHALATRGLLGLLRGDAEGVDTLRKALEGARLAGLPERIGGTYTMLGLALVHTRSHALANECLAEGIRYCSEHGLELYRLYLLAYRARSALDQGRWADAADAAAAVVRVPRATTMPRTIALTVLGLFCGRGGEIPLNRRPWTRPGPCRGQPGSRCEWGRRRPPEPRRRGSEGGGRTSLARPRRRSRSPRVLGSHGWSASSPAGAGAPASGRRSRMGLRSRTRSRSRATGRVPPSSGPTWVAPTRRRSRWPTRMRRSRCGARLTSCSAWARVRPPRSSRAGSARAARPDSRAGLAPRPRGTLWG